MVTPEYFETFGIRIVDGRALTAHDGAGAQRVAMVNERFVKGFELPEAADIANAIAFAIAAPVAVNIGHMEITPTLQVPGGLSTTRPETPRG